MIILPPTRLADMISLRFKLHKLFSEYAVVRPSRFSHDLAGIMNVTQEERSHNLFNAGETFTASNFCGGMSVTYLHIIERMLTMAIGSTI
jgi:hypothetical protein